MADSTNFDLDAGSTPFGHWWQSLVPEGFTSTSKKAAEQLTGDGVVVPLAEAVMKSKP